MGKVYGPSSRDQSEDVAYERMRQRRDDEALAKEGVENRGRNGEDQKGGEHAGQTARTAESSTPVLRHCRHCGASAALLTQDVSHLFRWRVSCVAKCCAISTPWMRMAQLAIDIWNRTARRPARKRKAKE